VLVEFFSVFLPQDFLPTLGVASWCKEAVIPIDFEMKRFDDDDYFYLQF